MLGKAPPERQKVKKGLLEALFLLVSRLDVKNSQILSIWWT
jgi:hypothetical protein